MIFILLLILLLMLNAIFIMPYSKKIRLVNVIIVGIIIVFLSSIRNTPDLDNYMMLYEKVYDGAKDKGFTLLLRLFALLDLDYSEDSTAQVDSNVVMTKSGKIIEFQTTAEGEPYTQEQLMEIFNTAKEGINAIINMY